MTDTPPRKSLDIDATHVENVNFGQSKDEFSAEHADSKAAIKSPYTIGAAVIASLGGFSFGYDQGVISIINVMDQFHQAYPEVDPKNPGSAFHLGLMTAILELGAFIGCFFMPALADRISRKRALTIVAVIFIIGAIIQTAAPNYGALVAGRFIGGIGVGTFALGAPLYISEIAPPKVRGALLALESVWIVAGAVIAYWITYGTRYVAGEAAFRLPFGLQIIPAFILGAAIHLFPYSPRWLALRERDEDALHSISKLRRLPPDHPVVQKEWVGVIAEVKGQKAVIAARHQGKTGIVLEVACWFDLFRPKTWRRTIVGLGVTFFQQFSGINGYIYYAPILYQSLGQSYNMSLLLSGMINICQLVAVLFCLLIIDKVGRRPLAIIGAFGCTVPYIIISVLAGKYGSDWANHQAAAWVSVGMGFAYMFIYGSTYSPLGWTLPAEVFSNAQRAKAIPPMVERSVYSIYAMFAVFCFLAGCWAVVFVPETKGKTLEELDAIFGDFDAMEEHRVMQEAHVKIEQDVLRP